MAEKARQAYGSVRCRHLRWDTGEAGPLGWPEVEPRRAALTRLTSVRVWSTIASSTRG